MSALTEARARFDRAIAALDAAESAVRAARERAGVQALAIAKREWTAYEESLTLAIGWPEAAREFRDAQRALHEAQEATP